MRRRFAESAPHPVSRWPACYGHLAACIVVYVVPLLANVAGFVAAPGPWRYSEATGRPVELFSGLMMPCLGYLLRWRCTG